MPMHKTGDAQINGKPFSPPKKEEKKGKNAPQTPSKSDKKPR